MEVFLAALEWKGFLSLSTNEQIAWLRRVAQHKIIDQYRKTGKMPEVALQLVEEIFSGDKNEDPEQKVIKQEELQQLQVAIHRLPPLQQQVLFLRFANGLRCVEIASILGKRDSTVRVLLSRAINHLRNTYHA
ncbi:hypothetical protein KDI_26770 [Dictyobacter arantiisoli]|uniref:RNA polymerase sigma factor 70 region 4 type 2 domain-containing protein n=1 Tax=Dictyobacter arantiisoli TaxID=2014874 RepID=A0A5A5TDI5_9CHLR|nr:hypothetical protein KDI_26770 [Dictyobacter arantiisoli]